MFPDYSPGHLMHHIQASHLGREPWGWRDGVVRSSGDGTHRLDYVHEDGSITVYSAILDELEVGLPVRVHEDLHALSATGTWYNVLVLTPGLGAVPTPIAPELWAAEASVGVVDLAAGAGVERHEGEPGPEPRTS